MSIQIYNTLSKRKEEFKPLEPGKVKMYVCGPTVYNLIHIGNARPMIIFDTVRRYMEYKGYEVNYVSNFTDVDDKIIKKANEEGVTAEEISQRYIAECKKDMAGMNVKPATTHPLATQEIDGMIEMIQTLIDKGYVYIAESPLYEISTKDRTYFAYTEPEKAAFLEKIGDKKYTIQRSKGLGENDPEMMWLTTMNPESRRLIKVMPTDVVQTAQVFDILLGDNLAGRKEHIAQHGAEYLNDLDVS